MRILVDVDGVLVKFVERVSDWGYRIDFPRWDGTVDIPEFYKQDVDAIYRYIQSAEFHHDIKIYEGVHEWLLKQRHSGHEVIAVTAPWKESTTWHYGRIMTLEKLGFKEKEIIFADKKQKPYVMGDVFIEDHVETLRQWEAKNSALAYLVKRPWNLKYIEVDNFEYVDSLADVKI